MSKGKTILARVVTIERMSFVFFVIYFLWALIFVQTFSNPTNLRNMAAQSVDLIILACGMTFVFMNGSIDFSVTAIAGLASILGARVMTFPGNPLLLSGLGVVVMLLIGVGIGCLNGLIITRLKMPSFIASMATSLIFSGLALWYTESATIGDLPQPFLLIGNSRPVGIPFPILLMIVVLAVSTYILHRTVLGRHIFAVGTNHLASRISGIAVNKTIFTLFVFSGILASIGTIVMTSKSGAGIPSMGKFMLMDVVGAVVLGGTAVTGGQGNMLGTAIGAVLIIVLNNSLNLLGVEWYIINALKGAMIIAVALLGILREGTLNDRSVK